MEPAYTRGTVRFADDLPFVWENGQARLVELPRQPFGDGRLYGHQNRMATFLADLNKPK